MPISRRALALIASSAILVTATAAAGANVRTDRPRILFGNGTGPGVTVATFKARCTAGGDPAYKRCAGSLASATDGPSLAASHVVTGDGATCSAAFDAVMA